MTHGFKLLGRQPGKEGSSWENFTKKDFMSKQTGSLNRFYSVFVQLCLLTSTRDLHLPFHGGKPQDVLFHLQLESMDLDIIKALNKNIFANRAV